jgi:uncharacterized protein (DUF58 family)
MTGREKPWRRHLKTTREGKAFIAVTIGVGLAAFNTGNNLIFLVLGFMLSLIVLSGILSEMVIRRVRVARRPPERAFAGATSLVELELFNKKKRVPSYSLEVEDLAEEERSERRCYFLKVGANSRQVAGYRRTPERRGYLRFSGFRVATRYPFGIFEKWRNLYVPGEMLVYPALLAEDRATRADYALGSERPMGRVGPGTEIVGLRDYAMGDEARDIHWMRSAGLGRLVVRERERDASSHLTITLDNARPRDAGEKWEERFERAISRAATIAVSSVSRGVSVEVVARGSRSPTVQPGSPADPVLRFLALLQPVSAEEEVAFAPRTRVSREVEVRLGVEEGAGPEAAIGPAAEAAIDKDAGPGTGAGADRARGGVA